MTYKMTDIQYVCIATESGECIDGQIEEDDVLAVVLNPLGQHPLEFRSGGALQVSSPRNEADGGKPKFIC